MNCVREPWRAEFWFRLCLPAILSKNESLSFLCSGLGHLPLDICFILYYVSAHFRKPKRILSFSMIYSLPKPPLLLPISAFIFSTPSWTSLFENFSLTQTSHSVPQSGLTLIKSSFVFGAYNATLDKLLPQRAEFSVRYPAVSLFQRISASPLFDASKSPNCFDVHLTNSSSPGFSSIYWVSKFVSSLPYTKRSSFSPNVSSKDFFLVQFLSIVSSQENVDRTLSCMFFM